MPIFKVVHVNDEPYDLYIGRPSKWGNPFVVGKDGTREEVIEMYRNWFFNQQDLIKDIKELDRKVLGCWCKPQACHGDFLKDFFEVLERIEHYEMKDYI